MKKQNWFQQNRLPFSIGFSVYIIMILVLVATPIWPIALLMFLALLGAGLTGFVYFMLGLGE